jgi:hypothetical protein
MHCHTDADAVISQGNRRMRAALHCACSCASSLDDIGFLLQWVTFLAIDSFRPIEESDANFRRTGRLNPFIFIIFVHQPLQSSMLSACLTSKLRATFPGLLHGRSAHTFAAFVAC